MPFLKSVSLKKRKRKAVTRIKQIAKIFKKGTINIYEKKEKKSCHLVLKVVIDLPSEGRKPEIQKKGESSLIRHSFKEVCMFSMCVCVFVYVHVDHCVHKYLL